MPPPLPSPTEAMAEDREPYAASDVSTMDDPADDLDVITATAAPPAISIREGDDEKEAKGEEKVEEHLRDWRDSRERCLTGGGCLAASGNAPFPACPNDALWSGLSTVDSPLPSRLSR